MNKHFVEGFEKKAFLAGGAGKLLGAIRKVPLQAKQTFRQAKKLPGQIQKSVQEFRDASARSFDVAQKKQLGFKGRHAAGMSTLNKPIDISKNVPKPVQIDGKTVYQKPAPKPVSKLKAGLGQAKNIAIGATVAGGVGAYYGLKDPEQPQSQPRQGY